ncbi:hypothetical protein M5D96_005865 [Drosophila gunungcola]|uniref:Uncharacterized protein n=1 Tax=Drosophila gunungcola TaxID=103775 RepID=A0A9Q0BRU9_9MUSC|nr:hypothetical protein M5D96_005865 [Drosophila gunungcola]
MRKYKDYCYPSANLSCPLSLGICPPLVAPLAPWPTHTRWVHEGGASKWSTQWTRPIKNPVQAQPVQRPHRGHGILGIAMEMGSANRKATNRSWSDNRSLSLHNANHKRVFVLTYSKNNILTR